jgi:bifunctional non-homologous end joining protein LigD
VAPYSPRARSGAPVSWLVDWREVKKGLYPKAYTMRTAPELLKRRKVWTGYEDAARPVREAIARLNRGRAA